MQLSMCSRCTTAIQFVQLELRVHQVTFIPQKVNFWELLMREFFCTRQNDFCQNDSVNNGRVTCVQLLLGEKCLQFLTGDLVGRAFRPSVIVNILYLSCHQ